MDIRKRASRDEKPILSKRHCEFSIEALRMGLRTVVKSLERTVLEKRANMVKQRVSLEKGIETEPTFSVGIPEARVDGNFVLALGQGGVFRGSMQHEATMEVSWCDDVARV
jgi:hypothetical protein